MDEYEAADGCGAYYDSVPWMQDSQFQPPGAAAASAACSCPSAAAAMRSRAAALSPTLRQIPRFGRHAPAQALGQLKPSYKRPPSPPVAHWWRGDRRFAASAAPTPITDGCDRFRAGVTAEMADTPAHLTVSGCVNFMDLTNMLSESLKDQWSKSWSKWLRPLYTPFRLSACTRHCCTRREQ